MSATFIRRAFLASVAASVGLAMATAAAQDMASRTTREFLQALASADQFEILSATTVLAQSRDPQVRGFAAKVMQGHQALARSLTETAARKGLALPEMAMSSDQAQLLGALQSSTGKEFDLLYLKQQTLAHRSAIVVDQTYANAGDDDDLRSFAASTLPVIAAHEEMSRELLSKKE